MKLYERPKKEETLDRLPEMPEGTVVPDDISGLQPPKELKTTAGAYRWMRWLAAIIVIAAAGALAAVLIRGSDNVTDPAVVAPASQEAPVTPTEGPGSNSLAPRRLNWPTSTTWS